MIKILLNATIFVLGVAGIALVGYLAAEPLAFTRPVREPPSIAAEHSPVVVPASVPVSVQADTNSILLAEVRITAAPPRAAKQSVVPARFDPCSDWRDVGVLVVDRGVATGVRNVRALCAYSSDER